MAKSTYVTIISTKKMNNKQLCMRLIHICLLLSTKGNLAIYLVCR